MWLTSRGAKKESYCIMGNKSENMEQTEQAFRDEVAKLNELVKNEKSDCSSQDVCKSVKEITKLFFGNISFIQVEK